MSDLIRCDHVTITHAGAATPALRDVTLSVSEGELVLVIGRTGSGKSTLLQCLNGAVPHFTGGTLAGQVTVDGRDTRTHQPRDLADVVGVVGQDPVAGFVTDTVEEELAYGMEQLGLPPATMRRRVEETLDLLGLAPLRGVALSDLSGGEQQRVAIGAVLTTHPQLLVLDEPTSALDPTGADEVLAAITRLVHDLGVTVVLAEHRIERVIGYADRIIEVSADGTARIGSPAQVMATSQVAPALVELGRYAQWSPLPLSVREARRQAGPLRDRLVHTPPPARCSAISESPISLKAEGIRVMHGSVVALRDVSLTLTGGSVTAVMGRNGAGKSSLLWALQGSGVRTRGSVQITRAADHATITPGVAPSESANPATATAKPATAKPGIDPADLSPAARRRLVALVPQSASDLLYLDSVERECAQADRESGAADGTCAALLADLTPGIPADRHPRDLSEGQRLALVLAIALTAEPDVVLLDEPTRGLDYAAKESLTRALENLAQQGRAVLLSTHDVEFVAGAADRVLVMASGEIVADGPSAQIVASSPAFAPQVSKVLAPLPLLTVADVMAADPDQLTRPDEPTQPGPPTRPDQTR